MNKYILSIALIMSALSISAQESDTAFFPKFESYSVDPLFEWNDFIIGSWADPTVLKVNDEYLMYTSAMHGGISTPEPISIYRFTSPDGYTWDLNPSTPVLEPENGTYFEGGIETPNVVYFNGMYHMYNTVYLQNIPDQFKISHATSTDGINWTIDNNPVFYPDPSKLWMSEIVAEPGALVKNDTLYLFFTAIGYTGKVSIGLARSLDGNTFIDTTQVVTIPNDIYPVSDGYLGVSTPDAVMVGDTIFLFTDLVREDEHTDWNQVGLHQFKSYGDINKWYYDTTNIHMSEDFHWTDGNYLSQLLGATPLMDGNRLRLWYWGYDLAQIELLDTTYHVDHVGLDDYPSTNQWGIGTSEYVYTGFASNIENDLPEIKASIHKTKCNIEVNNSSPTKVYVYSINGSLLSEHSFIDFINFEIDYTGIVILKVVNTNSVLTNKYIIKQ